MSFTQQELGERLGAWRRNQGISQEEAARRLGVPYRAYQRWENAESFPRQSYLWRLTEALGELAAPSALPPEQEDRLARMESKLDSLLLLQAKSDQTRSSLVDAFQELLKTVEELKLQPAEIKNEMAAILEELNAGRIDRARALLEELKGGKARGLRAT